MKFKIGETNFEISFTFFAIILILFCACKAPIFLISLLSSVAHEIIHLLFILLFSCRIEAIRINGFGVEIRRSYETPTTNLREAAISLSAPIFNLVIGLIFTLATENTITIGYVNLIIGGLNILPYFSFDGGRGLQYILKGYISAEATDKILNVLSVIVTIVITATGVYLYFYHTNNYSMIFLASYMICGILLSVVKPSKRLINVTKVKFL